ncbi:MAG: helix-turn-helix domain-containing protein, partial [Oliverpabstia sp.]
RMPIMDGLELSRRLHEQYPDIHTVIISGYDDFEYARAALANRVYDYLLKPVKITDLQVLLATLHKEIRAKRAASLYHCLAAQLNEAAPFSSAAACPGMENTYFSCFLICFGNLHMHCQPTGAAAIAAQKYDLIPWESVFHSLGLFPENIWIFPQQFDNIRLLLAEDFNMDTEEAAKDIYNYLKKLFPDIPITLTYRPGTAAFSDLYEERILLRRRLFSSLVIGKPALLNVEEEQKSLPPAVLSNSLIQYLQSLIESGNTSVFGQTLRKQFEDWNEKQYPQQWIEKILLQLFMVFQQCLYFSDEDYEQMTQSVFASLEMLSDYGNATEKIIQELQRWITLNKSVPSEINLAIEEMELYIRSHYRESLNIAELAQKYHFNQSYLTRVFKKQTGQSPLKLINELRILDARTLLKNPELSVKEISEILGFSEQHYFSRIFKDFTGQSPKEYRLQSAKSL